MGFEVPETAIVLGEHPLFIVRRYDREMMEGSGGGALQVLRRVHQEDFCQAIGLTSGGEVREAENPSCSGYAPAEASGCEDS